MYIIHDSMIYPHKKKTCSCVATLFGLKAYFARVGILTSWPGGSREALVSVSDYLFICSQFSCGYICCGDISGHQYKHIVFQIQQGDPTSNPANESLSLP